MRADQDSDKLSRTPSLRRGVGPWPFLISLTVLCSFPSAVSGGGCQWQWSNQVPRKTDLLRVRHGEGSFVAVGRNGVVLTSIDGLSWQEHDTGTSADLYGLARGAGHWVAVGWEEQTQQGVVLMSSDGTVWSVRGRVDGARLHDVAWGDGCFIVVGSGLGEQVLTSSNGLAWSARSTGLTIESAVIWAGDRFVAATGNQVYASAHGISWQQIGAVPAPAPRPLPYHHQYYENRFDSRYDLAWDGDYLYWAGSYALFWSRDGGDWQLLVEHGLDHDWSAFLTVETVTGDNQSFTVASAASAGWVGLTNSYFVRNELYIFTRDPGAPCLVSQWRLGFETIWGVAGNNTDPGVTVAAGGLGTIATLQGNEPYDAVWEYLPAIFHDDPYSCEGVVLLGHGPRGMVANGWYYPWCVIWDKDGSSRPVSSDSYDPYDWTEVLMTSADGQSWDSETISGGMALFPVAANGSVFVGVRYDAVVLSHDGLSWDPVAGTELVAGAKDIAWGGGRFVTVGPAGQIFLSKDGRSWSQVPTIAGEPELYYVNWTGSRFFALGRHSYEEGYLFMSRDGEIWETVQLENAAKAVASNGREHLVFGYRYLLILGEKNAIHSKMYGNFERGDVAYGGGRFVLVDSNVRMSEDGRRWTSFPIPGSRGFHDVIWFRDQFIAFGSDRTIIRLDCSPTLAYLDPELLTVQVGGAGELEVSLSEPVRSPTEISIETTTPDVLAVPDSVVIPAGSNRARFQVRARTRPINRSPRVTAILPDYLGGGQVDAGVRVVEATAQAAVPDLSPAGRVLLVAVLLCAGALVLRQRG